MWFLLPHNPAPQLFLYPSKKLLPAIMISSHMEENHQQNASFEGFKGKDTFVVSEWLRLKLGLELNLKAKINFVFCAINAHVT